MVTKIRNCATRIPEERVPIEGFEITIIDPKTKRAKRVIRVRRGKKGTYLLVCALLKANEIYLLKYYGTYLTIRVKKRISDTMERCEYTGREEWGYRYRTIEIFVSPVEGRNL